MLQGFLAVGLFVSPGMSTFLYFSKCAWPKCMADLLLHSSAYSNAAPDLFSLVLSVWLLN